MNELGLRLRCHTKDFGETDSNQREIDEYCSLLTGSINWEDDSRHRRAAHNEQFDVICEMCAPINVFTDSKKLRASTMCTLHV